MKLLLVSLVLLIVSGILILRKLIWFHKQASFSMVSIIIIVKDQEQWIEGFVRKLFILLKSLPQAKVLFINNGSSDKMLEVLRCLQRQYPFELMSVAGNRPEINILKLVNIDSLYPVLLKYDARGLKGKDLLSAPLFSDLARFNAGKFFVLSK
ncbi:MAG: hypothetical protein PHO01_05035 [Desulfotomaculaceae bacterium]|nr:hypothetical protein [Desulfotomaculaceae bacterium]